MNFTYETQGSITYLVCELAPTDQLDGLTLGMLTNNHIAGLAPVLYTEMNGQRFLKYNISAKVSADQFFSGTMSKQRALTAFQNILNAICSADEYMIDPACFSVVSEHIFLNVSNCETAMLCVPVVTDKDIHAEVATLFKKLLFSTQFDTSEDATYITQMITYINSGVGFSVYGLQDLVSKLQAGVPTGIQIPAAPQVAPQADVPATPVSSYDSTITIDQMNASADLPPVAPVVAPPAAPVAAPPVAPVAAPPVAPVAAPPVAPVASVGVPPTTPSMGRPIQGGSVPPIMNKAPQKPVKPIPAPVPVQPVPVPVKPAPAMPKPPVGGGPGFAIPGQVAKPSMPAAPASAPKQPAAAAVGDKKMSLFNLLSHYNKENAELYKKQREEAKVAKAEKAPKVPKAPNAAAVPQQPVMPAQPTMPQFQPPIQPVPVQNSFNETTVLSPIMSGGETTVLGADTAAPNPCLVRLKTGERILINKPVFRIGKEKSYVDYFIMDNTAISRSHANIHCDNGEYFIEDTNSTNHTYVNGSLINSNVKVKIMSGDQVKLANEEFTFTV